MGVACDPGPGDHSSPPRASRDGHGTGRRAPLTRTPSRSAGDAGPGVRVAAES